MTPTFNPTTGYLEVTIGLPPSANRCVREGRYGKYGSEDYVDWLNEVAPFLREVLGDWKPDETRWWWVEGELWMPRANGDSHNTLKPILDWLQGHRAAGKGERDEDGKPISKGKIVRQPGLFADDRRVNISEWKVAAVRSERPRVTLKVWPGSPPTDEAEVRKASERSAREQERVQARQAKADAHAAEMARRKAERERATAERRAEKARNRTRKHEGVLSRV